MDWRAMAVIQTNAMENTENKKGNKLNRIKSRRLKCSHAQSGLYYIFKLLLKGRDLVAYCSYITYIQAVYHA
jgi:hypothetical protein